MHALVVLSLVLVVAIILLTCLLWSLKTLLTSEGRRATTGAGILVALIILAAMAYGAYWFVHLRGVRH